MAATDNPHLANSQRQFVTRKYALFEPCRRAQSGVDDSQSVSSSRPRRISRKRHRVIFSNRRFEHGRLRAYRHAWAGPRRPCLRDGLIGLHCVLTHAHEHQRDLNPVLTIQLWSLACADRAVPRGCSLHGFGTSFPAHGAAIAFAFDSRLRAFSLSGSKKPGHRINAPAA